MSTLAYVGILVLCVIVPYAIVEIIQHISAGRVNKEPINIQAYREDYDWFD